MASSRDLLTGKKFESKREKVELEEFGEGEYVWVHGMTYREQGQHNASLMKSDWTGVSPARAVVQNEMMLVRCIRDDDGNPIFTMSDVPELGNWPAGLASRLIDVANRLSGEKTTKAEDEQAVKN